MDPAIKPLKDNPIFKENWGLIIVAAGMYGGRILPIVNVCWCFAHNVFLAITIYHSLSIDFDLALFSACIHYSLMLIAASAATINFTQHPSCIDEIIRNLSCDFHDYEGTIDPETAEEIEKEKVSMKTRKERVAKFFFVLLIATAFVAMVVFPLAFVDPKRGRVDALNRNLPVTLFYFFKTDTWLKWLVGLLAIYRVAYIITIVVMAIDIPFSCFAEEGVFHLKKLGIILKHSQRRAKYLVTKRYNETNSEYEDFRFKLCFRECLNHVIKHHYSVINYFEQIKRLYFYTLLIIMLSSTFLICLCGLLFVSDEVENGSKLQFMAYMIALLFHTFTFTWYGEMTAETCKEVREKIYESDWHDMSTEYKTYMLIMMAYLNNPITLSAGGFMVCNLNTFGNVLSSAYSYFNLLSVMITRGQ